jgi:hypothetical protein
LAGFAIFRRQLFPFVLVQMIKPGFEGYLSLKKEYCFTRHGIAFDKVLAVQLVQVACNLVKTDAQTIKKAAGLLRRSLDVEALKEAFVNHKLVSTYIHQRNDYTALLNAYFAGCGDYSQVHLPAMPYQTKISFKNIFTAFGQVFLKKHSGTGRQRFYIACYFAYYLNILESLISTFNNADLQGRKYVPFNSSFDLETLLTQFFAGRGVETYHISHGLSYVKYNNTVGFDAINGENITAANILVWGETSKTDLIKNYGRIGGNITVAGNPKYPYKRINIRTRFKKGILFLGAAIYDENNVGLLKLTGRLAKANNISFDAKAHPFSNAALLDEAAVSAGIELLPQDKTIDEILRSGNYDLAIAYNTTAYFEAMYYNMICFRYMVAENGGFNGLNDKFYDEKSFAGQLVCFKEKDVNELNLEVKQVLVDNLGMGINKYQTIFNH